MSEFANGAYEPGTYTKGDQTRVANTKAEAVQAVFDGFVRQADEAAPEVDEALEAESAEPFGENDGTAEPEEDPTPAFDEGPEHGTTYIIP